MEKGEREEGERGGKQRIEIELLALLVRERKRMHHCIFNSFGFVLRHCK